MTATALSASGSSRRLRACAQFGMALRGDVELGGANPIAKHVGAVGRGQVPG